MLGLCLRVSSVDMANFRFVEVIGPAGYTIDGDLVIARGTI